MTVTMLLMLSVTVAHAVVLVPHAVLSTGAIVMQALVHTTVSAEQHRHTTMVIRSHVVVTASLIVSTISRH